MRKLQDQPNRRESVLKLTPLAEIQLFEKCLVAGMEKNVIDTIKQYEEEKEHEGVEKQQTMGLTDDCINVEKVPNGYRLFLRGFNRIKPFHRIIIQQAFAKADRLSPVSELIIKDCSFDVVHYIIEAAQTNIEALKLQHLECENSVLNFLHLKNLIVSQRSHMHVIKLSLVQLHCENSLDSLMQKNRLLRFYSRLAMFSREQSLRTLFLQDYLKPSMLQRIRSISISLKPLISLEELSQQQRNWEQTKYENLLSELQDEVEAHLLMKNNITFRFQIEFGYTIQENTFNSKKGLQYSLDVLKSGANTIKEIIFLNLNRPNLSIWKILAVMLRALSIESIAFVNVPLMKEHLDIVKNLLWWNKRHLQRIVFGGSGLNVSEFEFLLMKDNLNISDFPKLTYLGVFDNEDLQCSRVFMDAQAAVMSNKKPTFKGINLKNKGKTSIQIPKEKLSATTTRDNNNLLGELGLTTTVRADFKDTMTASRNVNTEIILNVKAISNSKNNEILDNPHFNNPPNSLRNESNPKKPSEDQADTNRCDFTESELKEGTANEVLDFEQNLPGKIQETTNKNIFTLNEKPSLLTISNEDPFPTQDSDKKWELMDLSQKKSQQQQQQQQLSSGVNLGKISKKEEETTITKNITNTENNNAATSMKNSAGNQQIQVKLPGSKRGMLFSEGTNKNINNTSTMEFKEDEQERKQSQSISRRRGVLLGKQEFKEITELQSMSFPMYEIEASGVFQAENEDALNTILKNHLLEKDSSRRFDLSRVNIGKCSELTQRYLIEYISQSKRLQELVLVNYPETFLAQLTAGMLAKQKSLQLCELSQDESVGESVLSEFLQVICVSTKTIILSHLNIRNSSAANDLSQNLLDNQQVLADIQLKGALSTDKNRVSMNSLTQLLAGLFGRTSKDKKHLLHGSLKRSKQSSCLQGCTSKKSNRSKELKKQQFEDLCKAAQAQKRKRNLFLTGVASTPQVAYAIHDAFVSYNPQTIIEKINLDGNLLTHQTITALLTENADSLTTLAITNLANISEKNNKKKKKKYSMGNNEIIEVVLNETATENSQILDDQYDNKKDKMQQQQLESNKNSNQLTIQLIEPESSQDSNKPDTVKNRKKSENIETFQQLQQPSSSLQPSHSPSNKLSLKGTAESNYNYESMETFTHAMNECSMSIFSNPSITFPVLVSIDFSGNHKQINWMPFLSTILSKAENVKELYLRGDETGVQSLLTSGDVIQLIEIFAHSTLIRQNQLEIIDLSYNCDKEIQRSLPDILQAIFSSQKSSLKTIKLCGGSKEGLNMISMHNLIKLTKAFKAIKELELTEINISQNTMNSAQDKKYFCYFIESFMTCCRRLSTLGLSGKPGESMITDDIAERLSETFQKDLGTLLKKVDISNNLALSAAKFGEVLRSLKSRAQGLEYINLSGSNTHVMLTNEKADELVSLLEEDPDALHNIKEIDLSRNVALSARTLGELLGLIFRTCPLLSTLRLKGYDSFSMIENQKAKALVIALQNLPYKFQSLLTAHSDIASHHDTHPAFKLLDISQNNIDAAPLDMLFKSLLENTSLKARKISQSRTSNLLLLNNQKASSSDESKIDESSAEVENRFAQLLYLEGGRVMASLQEVVITEIALLNPKVLENLTKTLLGGCFQSLRKLGLIGSPKMEVLDDERVEMLSGIFEEYSCLLRNLEEVDFSWNSINAGPLRLFLESAFMCSSIKRLRLSGSETYSMITNTRAQALVDFFETKQRFLTHIDLSFNRIEDAEVLQKLFSSLLTSNKDTLQFIGFYYLNSTISSIFMSSLIKVMCENDQQNTPKLPMSPQVLNESASPYGKYGRLFPSAVSTPNKSSHSRFQFFSDEMSKFKFENKNKEKEDKSSGEAKQDSNGLKDGMSNKGDGSNKAGEAQNNNNNMTLNTLITNTFTEQDEIILDKIDNTKKAANTFKNYNERVSNIEVASPDLTITPKDHNSFGSVVGFFSKMFKADNKLEVKTYKYLEEISMYCTGCDRSILQKLKKTLLLKSNAHLNPKHRREGWGEEIETQPNHKDSCLQDMSIALVEKTYSPETVVLDKSIVGQLSMSECAEKVMWLLQEKKGVVIRRDAMESLPLLSYCFSLNRSMSSLHFEKLLKRNIECLVIGELFLKTCRSLIPIRPEGNYIHSMVLNNYFLNLLEQSNKSENPLPLKSLIFPSSTILAGFERVKDGAFIENICTKCEPVTSLKNIQLEYEFDQEESMNVQLNELEVIQKLLLMPPTVLKTKKTVNLNFLKAVFSILHDSLYFQSALIDYDHSSSLNTGIVVSLLERVYAMPHHRSLLHKFSFSLRKFTFYILFQLTKEETIFHLDSQVLRLNEDLPTKRAFGVIFSNILIVLNVLQIFVQFTPLILSDLSSSDTVKGIPIGAYYAFALFGIMSFLVELYLYIDLLKYIAHLIPGLKMSNNKGIISAVSNSFKQFLMNIKYFNYKILKCGNQLLQSLFQRYDTFSDLVFFVICYQTKFYLLAYLSLGTLILNLTVNYMEFLRYLFRKRKVKRVLNTDNLIRYYKIASLAECTALSEQLDQVLPYNVKQLPNWCVLGNWKAESINQRVFSYMFKFLFKNSPQIVLQTLYLLYSEGDSINYIVILSMTTSIASFCLSFLNFLTIRPSAITQIDFNELADKKQLELLSSYEKQEAISDRQFKAVFPDYYIEDLETDCRAAKCLKKSQDESQNVKNSQGDKNQQNNVSVSILEGLDGKNNKLRNVQNTNNEQLDTSSQPLNKSHMIKLTKTKNSPTFKNHKNSLLLETSQAMMSNILPTVQIE